MWAETVASNTVFLGTLGRTRKAEQVRLQAELDRAQRVGFASPGIAVTDGDG